MAGAANTFSAQLTASRSHISTSMAAPVNFHCDPDRVEVNTGKRDAYTVSQAVQTEAERAFCAPLASRSFLPGRSGWVFGIEGSLFRVDPSPRLRLGTFNGRRPARESLVGNGGGAPPVSRFLYRPHCRRIKSESQGVFETWGVGQFPVIRLIRSQRPAQLAAASRRYNHSSRAFSTTL